MSSRQTQALGAALDLLRMPSKARAMRSAPLPPGIFLLLRLAAEEAEAQTEAQRINKRAPNAHREAAIFFIEQILLSSGSDAYRMLGLDQSATNAELRRHMVYLLKWLHPDRNGDPHKTRLARRVLLAWNELRAGRRTKGQRNAPDKLQQESTIQRDARKRRLAVVRFRREGGNGQPQSIGRLKKNLRLRCWPH
jgi:hypothetical protein